MSNYTQQKFCLGTVWGKTEGTNPWPSLRTSPGRGDCAYVARGIDDPAACSGQLSLLSITGWDISSSLPSVIHLFKKACEEGVRRPFPLKSACNERMKRVKMNQLIDQWITCLIISPVQSISQSTHLSSWSACI